ncbi:MAG: hypothetical protein GXO10_06700 [Crenarchaeota archaeon]|nr:hypothetical protein [Thermoproteota archaeon]
MLRLSRRTIFIIILVLAILFYSLSAYGIWSVTLIPDVIRQQLTTTQLTQIYTMYTICVVLTTALGIVTYLLVERTKAPTGGRPRKAYAVPAASTAILVAAFIILLIACITSYYYLAQVTAPLSP